MILILLAVLASPAQIDKAGREAFTALRNFQVAELAAREQHGTWPTPEQHRDILAKIAIAHECVDDSLVIGRTLNQGPLSPQALSMLRSEVQAVAAINGLVGPNAPKAIRTLTNKLQDAFAKLFALFPVGQEFYEHPPK